MQKTEWKQGWKNYIKTPGSQKKVDFSYTKLDLNNIPQTWIKIWNLISTKNLTYRAA